MWLSKTRRICGIVNRKSLCWHLKAPAKGNAVFNGLASTSSLVVVQKYAILAYLSLKKHFQANLEGDATVTASAALPHSSRRS